jgi:hypothetical protein
MLIRIKDKVYRLNNNKKELCGEVIKGNFKVEIKNDFGETIHIHYGDKIRWLK